MVSQTCSRPNLTVPRFSRCERRHPRLSAPYVSAAGVRRAPSGRAGGLSQSPSDLRLSNGRSNGRVGQLEEARRGEAAKGDTRRTVKEKHGTWLQPFGEHRVKDQSSKWDRQNCGCVDGIMLETRLLQTRFCPAGFRDPLSRGPRKIMINSGA